KKRRPEQTSLRYRRIRYFAQHLKPAPGQQDHRDDGNEEQGRDQREQDGTAGQRKQIQDSQPELAAASHKIQQRDGGDIDRNLGEELQIEAPTAIDGKQGKADRQKQVNE